MSRKVTFRKQNLDCSIKWTTAVNSWTACKSKSSFLSCEAEFSAIISFKTCVFGLNTFARENQENGNMQMRTNFNETAQMQISKAVYKAFA